MVFFARNGGFLFPERWLFIFVIGGSFPPDYAHSLPKELACKVPSLDLLSKRNLAATHNEL
jgi:hypothetical protein